MVTKSEFDEKKENEWARFQCRPKRLLIASRAKPHDAMENTGGR